MKFVLASVGSMGDALPYIALGSALRARGHAVAFFCNAEHQQATEAAGLEYLAAGDGLHYSAAVANPNLWHPVKGLGVLWRSLLAPSIAPLYGTVAALHKAHPGLRVLAGPQMMGARLAQEHLGIDLTTLYTSPGLLRSCEAPVTVAHTYWPGGTPRWWLRGLWWAVDRYKLEPMARPGLTSICQGLGVAAPVTSSVFGSWMHSPQRAVALFAPWFAPRKADYPAHLVYGGFVPGPAPAQASMPDGLQAFLDAGSAPVVVMLGTAMAHAKVQFAVWHQALHQLGMRGVFLSPYEVQFAQPRSERIFYAGYAPFPLLLPQASALVHHGGIGSCAQALQAGIAQIIQPSGHDQFENARCAVAIGVAEVVRRDAPVYQASAALA
ncbi:MAG: nucleotide disphospho-sugar-binding domain-containing protein, partial [Burkholderiaceae bacterium]